MTDNKISQNLRCKKKQPFTSCPSPVCVCGGGALKHMWWHVCAVFVCLQYQCELYV